MSLRFTIERTAPASKARAGLLVTDHGTIRTPIFMPVGTAATVKGLFHRDVRDEVRAEIILANTYHLYLRPGMRIIEQAGGVHRFSTWEGPMLTDSGGFQVFSLAACRKLEEEGCHFRSHIDGSKHLFTPESVIDTERTIGADIMMAFDECPPGDAPYDYAARSLALTERWLDRCFDRYRQTAPKYGHYQALFPIVQGCAYADLRARAAENVLQNVLGGAGAEVGIGAPLHDGKEGLVVAVLGGGLPVAVEAAVEPALGEGQRAGGVVVGGVAGGAFVESHHDVGADRPLGVDDALGGEEVLRAVDVRAEVASLLLELAAGG